MDLKKIRELMNAMKKSDIKKLRVKEKDGSEIEMEREGDHKPSAHTPFHAPLSVEHHPHYHPPMTNVKNSLKEEAPPAQEQEGKFVTSPMVGTFYASPSPDDPAFVKVGDKVEEDTIICIIEAMKVMNEVKAGVRGVVQSIMAENGHPVEFGTKLFKIG